MSEQARALERCMAAGGVALFGADTVYGLACDPQHPDAIERLYALKGRPPAKPSAVMWFGVEQALQALPELGPRTREALSSLLPGGLTALVPNPAHRFPLACAGDRGALGIRVPEVPELAGAQCAVLQSSANLAGGPDARRLEDVPEAIRAGVDLVLDRGELPGVASTVVDLRRYEDEGSWTVVRKGAVPELALRQALDWQSFFDPDNYEEAVRVDVAAYDRLHAELIAASGQGARSILELGTGTGHTARRLLERHPQAELVGVDASEQMLVRARSSLPAERVRLNVGRLEQGVPAGPFDLVASALCVHHLDGRQKAELFCRVHAALGPGGRFVLADVVIPREPGQARVPLSPGLDKPSPVDDQAQWLTEAGFEVTVPWEERDLAVIVAVK